MKPKPKSFEEVEKYEDQKDDPDINKKLFPGLALPNDPKVRVSLNILVLCSVL